MSMIASFAAVTPDQLALIQRDPAQVVAQLSPSTSFVDSSRWVSIDKAWHGIHYLLTGSPWEGDRPLSLAVLGGTAIGDDLGYGPARFLTPDEVQAVATSLNTVSSADLANRFDAQVMQNEDIYPSIWVEEGSGALEYVKSYYVDLVDFYRRTAERGDGVICYLT